MTSEKIHTRFPFSPFPAGIFAVAFSKALAPKKVMPLVFMGKKIVLFRTASGALSAVDAYCPHLGADLSQGSVCQETLQCPFHGLRFNTAGKAGQYQLNHWPVFEQYGLIFLRHELLGKPCDFSLPEWDIAQWGKPIQHIFKIRSHPQEILENSVDERHFFQVHRYLTLTRRKPFETKGAEFFVSYDLERAEGLFGAIEKKKIAVQIDIHAIGLGMSQVDIYLPRYGLHAKQIVFPTPIDGDYVEVRTLTSVKMLEKWGILKKPIANFLSFLTSKGFLKDFLPDIQIWENKAYIENPVYFSNDGPIADYRRWASQFYEHTPQYKHA